MSKNTEIIIGIPHGSEALIKNGDEWAYYSGETNKILETIPFQVNGFEESKIFAVDFNSPEVFKALIPSDKEIDFLKYYKPEEALIFCESELPVVAITKGLISARGFKITGEPYDPEGVSEIYAISNIHPSKKVVLESTQTRTLDNNNAYWRGYDLRKVQESGKQGSINITKVVDKFIVAIQHSQ